MKKQKKLKLVTLRIAKINALKRFNGGVATIAVSCDVSCNICLPTYVLPCQSTPGAVDCPGTLNTRTGNSLYNSVDVSI